MPICRKIPAKMPPSFPQSCRQFKRHLSSSQKFLQLLLNGTEFVKPITEMPGPRSLPWVGTLYKYITGEYDFKKPYKKGVCLKEQYGRVAREDLLPGVRMIHVFDADDVQKVLKHEGRCPRRPVPQPLKIYREQRNFSGGLATLHGEEWQRYRSHVQKYTLRPKIVASYMKSQEVIAHEFVERMGDLRQPGGKIEDYITELYRWACESVAIVCFDTRLGLLDKRKENENEFFVTLGKYFACLQDLLYSTQIHVKLQTKCWKNYVKYSDVMWEHTLRMVNNAMEKMDKSNEENSNSQRSLLESLLSEESLKRDEVMVLVNDLLTGGVESTAHTMAFLLCNLANHPEVQERLRQEVLTMVPHGKPLDENVLYQMKYMNACLKESFRVLPSVPYGVVRILSKNITLQGYEVPAGTIIMAHTMVTSKDSRYFEDPGTYRPERWLCPKQSHNSGENHPFAVLPFGFGPRMCVGRRFAEQELYLLIIHILRKFRVHSNYTEPVGQTARTFMAPDGPLRLTFEPL